MTIKEQIQKKIEGYKEDFYKECGFHIIVIPQVSIDKVSLYDVCKFVCFFLDLEVEDLNSNKKVAVKAKEFIVGVSLKMGYDEKEVYKAIEIDRTTMYTMIRRFRESIEEDRPYKYDFYKFLEYLYIQVNKEEFIKGKEWIEKVDFLDSIFITDEKPNKPRAKGVSKGSDAALNYIKENKYVRGNTITDYLLDMKYFKTKTSAHQTLQNLKKQGKIYRAEEGYWKLT